MKCITSTALHIDICQLFNKSWTRKSHGSNGKMKAAMHIHCVLTEALIGLKRFHQPLKACDEGLEVDAREPHLIIRRKDRMQKLSGRNSYFCNLCRM